MKLVWCSRRVFWNVNRWSNQYRSGRSINLPLAVKREQTLQVWMRQRSVPRKSRGTVRGSHVWLSSLGLLTVALLGGCRSRAVDVTIVNQGPALHLVEFDYPNASFGVNNLASGGNYHYRIKVQGTGPVSLQYEAGDGRKGTATGPTVNMSEQGALTVSIDAAGAVQWRASLNGSK